MNTYHFSFEDLMLRINAFTSFVEDVTVIDRTYLHVARENHKKQYIFPFRIDAVTCILCSDGEITFSIDYTTYHLSKGALLILTNLNIIDQIFFDDNSDGVALIISQKLMMDIVQETPVIKKIMKVNNYPHEQVLNLDNDEMCDLKEIVMRIKKCLTKSDHAFQSHIVRNEVSIFVMEVAHIYLQKIARGDISPIKESRRDENFRAFALLVLKHVREQHDVTFYANKLGMTPGNLSRTITAVSGKSPLQLISEVLVVEAKTLLRKPDSNIKQVSDELNFGDQSSFGKFFKKHTGLTPVEYKNREKE